jgi:DNA (cytosine-5)-methyltransferase 1
MIPDVLDVQNCQAGSEVGLNSAGVRRLTPLECERLQGWPDGHTQYTADGKLIPDSHRYRMIGNGVVATVAEWIGHRLMASMNTLIGAAV